MRIPTPGPDNDHGIEESVGAHYQTGSVNRRAPDAWGSIGIWAWGLSRALDCLERDPELDARRVALHGHSRLGKAALSAGAQDERSPGFGANSYQSPQASEL